MTDHDKASHPISALRKYLLAGLLVWLPLGVTVLVIKALVELMDRVLVFIPDQYHPESLLGFHIPGLGVLLSLVVLFVTGLLRWCPAYLPFGFKTCSTKR